MAVRASYDTSDNSSSKAAASIGDNSYYVDNGVSLDLSGGVVDTSTNVGLVGQDLHVLSDTLSGITNNAFSTILGVSAQNAENQRAVIQAQETGIMGILNKNSGYILGFLLVYALKELIIRGRK